MKTYIFSGEQIDITYGLFEVQEESLERAIRKIRSTNDYTFVASNRQPTHRRIAGLDLISETEVREDEPDRTPHPETDHQE